MLLTSLPLSVQAQIRLGIEVRAAGAADIPTCPTPISTLRHVTILETTIPDHGRGHGRY